MRVVVTGAEGFLGWHVRARLHAQAVHEVVPVGRSDWADLPQAVGNADAIVHLAGINRGEAKTVEAGNVSLAQDVADAVGRSGRAPAMIFANSVQAGNSTPYGSGKAAASQILAKAATEAGATYTDILLPNLFGEGGRPNYNSFVATFVDRVVRGERVEVEDRDIALLHAQDAAQVVVEALTDNGGTRRPVGTSTSVARTLETLNRLFEVYQNGEIPALACSHEVNLLNTLRARMFALMPTAPLVRRVDTRGALVEAVRAHGSAGQAFVSTTKAGITRGQHFHLRKLERFAVVDGTAEIALRRLFSDEVATFHVSGENPVAIDMPTGWAHKITNTGDSTLTTVFWTNELFDPEDADTYPEEV